jgi:hypothetical protein
MSENNICTHCGAVLPPPPSRFSSFVKCNACGWMVEITPLDQLPHEPVAPPQKTSTPEVAAPLVPAPPPEDPPTPSIPRSYSRPKPHQALGNSGCGGGCVILFGIFWTLFSAVFVVIGIGTYFNEHTRYDRLTREGQTTQGIISDKEVDDSGDSTSYYIDYRFKANYQGKSQIFNDRASVSSTNYNSTEIGQKIEVIYAASDPNISALKVDLKPPSLLIPVCFGGMGGLFVFIGLGTVLGAVRASIQTDRLNQNGQTTQGSLTERWTEKDSDGDTTYLVAYTFTAQAEDGTSHQVNRSEYNRQAYHTLKEGDAVTVRYLPGNPETCQLILPRK